MLKYNPDVPADVMYTDKLRAFTCDLGGASRSQVDTRGLLVFRYALDTLIDPETPDMFTRTMLHKHVLVTRSLMESVLRDIRRQRRTQDLARVLDSGYCECNSGHPSRSIACRNQCQPAYAYYYNHTETHPFIASKSDHSYYFAHLYWHLVNGLFFIYSAFLLF